MMMVVMVLISSSFLNLDGLIFERAILMLNLTSKNI